MTAALEYLTGPVRGTATWLNGNTLDVLVSDSRVVRIAESGCEQPAANAVARLHLSGDTYEIEALEGTPLWVNGVQIGARRLEQRDLIEFGETGPLSRFRIYRESSPVRKSVADIVSDCVDYARVSRRPLGARLRAAFADFLKSLTYQTTFLFRLSVIVSIFALVAITYSQYRSNVRLQAQVESDSLRLEAFSRALYKAQQESLTSRDLGELRREVDQHLTAAVERLNTLEQRSEASRRVISSARQSIVFLQGAYGFRHKATGAVLKHSIGDDQEPLLSPRGQPLLTLDGDGPAAIRQFTGTAFVIDETGMLLTNRHVALPWEDDASVQALGSQGLEPYLVRFVGYLPNTQDPFDVKLLQVSDVADIALLSCSGVTGTIPSLPLGEPPNPGDEVIVMGYPTGLRSLLAQTGKAFLKELQSGDDLDFWAVAQKLSESQFIQPLASRGIVGQVSPAAIVYDAETTHGGSGGPVLNVKGQVIAVNTAIIPEYGGSNFGVPVEFIRQLLMASKGT
jgi:S1-C subfamily serine protease